MHEALGLRLGRRAFVWTLGLVGDPPFLLEGDLLVGTQRSPQVTAKSGPGLLTRKEPRSHSL